MFSVACAGTSGTSQQSSAAASSSASSASKSSSSTTSSAEYASKLFDTSYVHTIDISITDEDWADLKANPTDKTKYKADITIDGEKVEQVSFATKGNTSLTSVASDPDSDRYSFKVNFGKYTDGQTYHGLDKLDLNNLYADAAYMKDYLSYTLMNKAGVESPLVSYVWVTVNGEDFGLYLAIEDLDSSYLDRTTGGDGELYKPETEMLGNMGEMGQGGPGGGQMPEGMQFPGGGFGFGGNANGADLAYTDDELSSYSDIFDNAETKVTEEDEQRVIAALKNLSEGNVESAVNTSEVINYFAAHNFVLNYDSYTGMMLHNYFLYENDGKLSMLPWDYNLAFGGFGGGDNATSLVNTGIDSPLSGADESSRPMWSWITASDQYKVQYHEALDSLVKSYFESGDFEKEIDALYEMLLPYVEKDPSAFYTADEFKEGYQTLKQFCLLRAQSIRAQLDGTLATTSDAQDSSAQIDASSLNVDAMGKQGGGGNGGPGGFGGGGFPGR